MVVAAPQCPVHVVGKRIVNPAGRTVYTDPGYRAVSHEIRCSGRTVWVMFHGGAAASQEAYVLVRSADGGRTWKLVAAEGFFGVTAPHAFDSYSGPWTIVGAESAYFVGSCPACDRWTVSLWVTHDGGRTFRRYAVPALTGYGAELESVRVAGTTVTIVARGRSTTVQA